MILHHLLAMHQHYDAKAGHFVLRGIKAVLVFVGSIIAAIICGVIAKIKGRTAIGWGLLGLFFSIITLIVVIVIPRKR